jgi:acetyl esterase
MPIDPQIQAMLAGAPPYPGASVIPLETLRGVVRDFALAFPKPLAPLGAIGDHAIARPDGSSLMARAYAPSAQGPWPILVYFHGGGFALGDLESQDMICRALCAAARCLVVSVGYRLAPEHVFPAAVDDGWTALNWVFAHGPDLGGDPTRLAVGGDSAGGTLAAATALRAKAEGGPKLAAQLMFYGSAGYPFEATASRQAFKDGPILTSQDIDYFWGLYLADPQIDGRHPYASPRMAASHAGLPPAFVATAEIDPSRDDGEDYARLLQAAGVPTVQRRYPGMVHGFLSWVGVVDAAQSAIDEASAWLNAQWDGAGA